MKTKEQLEKKQAKLNHKYLKNSLQHIEERNALILQILNCKIPNWNLKLTIKSI